jgi:predicted nucleic acid-binding protein
VNEVLLDTGCIVALLDRGERNHQDCVEALKTVSGRLVTCDAVIAESCYLLRHQRGAADTILENVQRGAFQIPLRIDEMAAAVRGHMKRYARVPMDLADACLVALAETLGTGRILTLDSDFQIYRWRRTRRFEYLIDAAG